ncbi:PLD nuclease N-terminal domain-containing protein [Pseudodesulfovibrio sediminis]|uniref:PLD nuclease N-terminal domain-containing protein n=1 Tax=Pseudodesulfovibrio sediminis TaxID=2810563 RepID=UPI001E46AF66|nr:PLD nuclease N-terminal domain-containing protein [Pseudodesulfovibrio sediminis]
MFADFSALSTTGWALILVLVGCCFSYSVWAILDVWKRTFASASEKSLWMQICIFIPIFGATAYLFIGRNRGSKIQ